MRRSHIENSTEHPLGRPLRLACGALLPNRIAKSATSEALATGHMLPHRAHERLYTRWADGGAGLLVTGNVMVDRRTRVARGDVCLEEGVPLGPFQAWARAMPRSSRLWMQISHPGRQAPRVLDARPVAPSPIRLTRGLVVFATPRELEDDEVSGLVTRFADSARLASEAGFDGVQIHAAHGYLVHQFLSRRTNTRSDGWGGTPARRRRFLLEIVRAARASVRAGFAIGVKMNAPEQRDVDEEEALDTARALRDEGVDLLELSGGTYEHDALLGRADRSRSRGRAAQEAFFAPFAERLRRAVDVPLCLSGGFRTAAGMSRAVVDGVADVVGLSRGLILDPDLPRRILAGDVRPVTLGRPSPLGLRATDAPMELAWYSEQIRRLAHGELPDPAHPRRRALASALRAFVG